MRALTLWQPWAGAMALGLKTIETRGWFMSYRGDLCIHAGAYNSVAHEMLTRDLRRQLQDAHQRIGGPAWYDSRSAILAVVEVTGCWKVETLEHAAEYVEKLGLREITDTERSLGDYSPGRYGILTSNLRVLRNPVPCSGHQGLWTLNPQLEAAVRAELPKETT